jgi:hypothetical protein
MLAAKGTSTLLLPKVNSHNLCVQSASADQLLRVYARWNAAVGYRRRWRRAPLSARERRPRLPGGSGVAPKPPCRAALKAFGTGAQAPPSHSTLEKHLTSGLLKVTRSDMPEA